MTYFFLRISLKFKNFIYLYLVVQGLRCCESYSLVAKSRGYSLVAPKHMGSSGIRDWMHVSYIGRQILCHWATREALFFKFIFKKTIFIYLSGLPWCLSGKDSTCQAGDVVQSLGREDLLEKEMATHSSILAWEIPWTEEPGGLQSMGSQRIGYDWVTKQ